MMKKIAYFLPVVLGFILITTANSCKEPKTQTDTKPSITISFKPMFDGLPMVFRTTDYTKPDGEVMQMINWGMILSKVSLVKTDDTKVMLGDGYLWIDFYSNRSKFNFKEIPEGDYKGISIQFGVDSLVNHGDPTIWPAEHPLNANLSGYHWGWAGGYIFQVMDGSFRDNKDSSKVRSFSYHTVGDQFKRNYMLNLNFSLENNTNKTASIELACDEFFKNPLAIKIGDFPSNHSGGTTELNWMNSFIGNANDVYKLKEVK